MSTHRRARSTTTSSSSVSAPPTSRRGSIAPFVDSDGPAVQPRKPARTALAPKDGNATPARRDSTTAALGKGDGQQDITKWKYPTRSSRSNTLSMTPIQPSAQPSNASPPTSFSRASSTRRREMMSSGEWIASNASQISSSFPVDASPQSSFGSTHWESVHAPSHPQSHRGRSNSIAFSPEDLFGSPTPATRGTHTADSSLGNLSFSPPQRLDWSMPVSPLQHRGPTTAAAVVNNNSTYASMSFPTTSDSDPTLRQHYYQPSSQGTPASPEPEICSSCGAQPAATFVALVPCDHVVCQGCFNALIDACSNRPPRPMDCFACKTRIDTFGPAFDLGGHSLFDAALSEGRVRVEQNKQLAAQKKAGLVCPAAGYSFGINASAAPVKAFGYAAVSASHAGGKRPVMVDGQRQYSHSGLSEPTSPCPSAGKGGGAAPLKSYAGLPIDWPVLRLDNIPWMAQTQDISDWLPENALLSRQYSAQPVHILCNRADGRTLNQAYVECFDVDAAQTVIRLRNGTKLQGRPISITLSSQAELLTIVFPSWDSGFAGVDALDQQIGPDRPPRPLITQTELTGLLDLCKLETLHSWKVAERPYANLVTIISKAPWHQSEKISPKLVIRLFAAVYMAVETLLSLSKRLYNWQAILKNLVEACLECPAFRNKQKVQLATLAGFSWDAKSDADAVPPLGNQLPQLDASGGGRKLAEILRDTSVSVSVPGAVEVDGDDDQSSFASALDSPSSPPVNRIKATASGSPKSKASRVARKLSFSQAKAEQKSPSKSLVSNVDPFKLATKHGVQVEVVKAIAKALGVTLV